MVLGDSFAVLPVLDIVRAHNTGAAFSFLADAGGWQRWVLAAGRGRVASRWCSGCAGWRSRRRRCWPSGSR